MTAEEQQKQQVVVANLGVESFVHYTDPSAAATAAAWNQQSLQPQPPPSARDDSPHSPSSMSRGGRDGGAREQQQQQSVRRSRQSEDDSSSVSVMRSLKSALKAVNVERPRQPLQFVAVRLYAAFETAVAAAAAQAEEEGY